MPLPTFQKVIRDSEQYSTRHVLLGNGFSIACRPDIFTYGKLFEQADFSKVSATAKLAFEALKTQDFEKVIKALRDTKIILEAYGGISPMLIKTLENDADGLRELLVQTIAENHPAWPGELTEEEYEACRTFLSYFKNVYSLNYDLLIYWASMHTAAGQRPDSDDGFRKSQDDIEADYVVWEPGQSHEQNMWFLHGALHVFDAGIEIQKYTWVNTGVRLIDQIRDALNRGFFPLFVAEGTSAEKYTRIRHNDYLAKAYRSFCEIKGALFIYGHSLASNDDHYLRRIQLGKIEHLFVGIYGNPDLESNKYIMRKAHELSSGRRSRIVLNVSFFDADSAKVWGK